VVLLTGTARPPAVVHVDLDGAREIYAAHGWNWPHDEDPLFASGLRATLELLDVVGVRATLFVIAQALDDPRKRDLLEEAVRRGHQVGSHTTTHRRLTALSADERRREIAGSRERLMAELGTAVDGFRAPGFFTDAAVMAQVAEAGYRYDSSLFAGQAFGGDRAVIAPAPSPLATGAPAGRAGNAGAGRAAGGIADRMSGAGLFEVPLPAYRPLPLPFHPSYSLVLGTWYFGMGLRRVHDAGGPFVLLLHLTDLADPLNADYLIGWKSRIFTLSHLSTETKRRRCGAMLAAVGERYAWTTTDRLLPVEGVKDNA